MLTLDIRNLYNPKYDEISGAALYLDPSASVYPSAATAPKPNAVSSWGSASLAIDSLSPGEHTLWIIPKFASDDPVGVKTAASVNTDRIYRILRIQLSIGNKRMTGALVHASTLDYGTVVADVKQQHLTVRLRAVWMKSGLAKPRAYPLDMIVVHKTGGNELGSSLQTILAGSEGSSHYLINRDGHVIKFVLDTLASGHAAPENSSYQSHWGTQTTLAHRSIGIENVGADGNGLTDDQYKSLVPLLQELMTKFNIKRHRVIGHSDCLTDGRGHLDDNRRQCPGPEFDWPRLENAKPNGVGLSRAGGSAGGSTDPVDAFFAAQASANPNLELKFNDHDADPTARPSVPGKFGGGEFKGSSDKPIAQLQTRLAEIGYSVGPATGIYNQQTVRAVLHFQTHFIGKAATDRVNRQTAALINAVRQANPKAD